MTPEQQQIFDTLLNHSEYFQLDNMFTTMARWVGWAIIKWLIGILQVLQKSLYLAIGFITGFLENPEIQEMLPWFERLGWAIATIAVIVLCIRKIINPKHDISQVVENACLGFIVFICSTTVMMNVLTYTKELTQGIWENSVASGDYVYDLINKTGTDLPQLVDSNFQIAYDDGTPKRMLHLDSRSVKFFDYAEVINTAEEVKEQIRNQESEEATPANMKVYADDHPSEYRVFLNKILEQKGASANEVLPEWEEQAEKELWESHHPAREIDFDSISSQIYGYKLGMDRKGQLELIKVDQGTWLNIPQRYYRFNFNYLAVFIFTIFMIIVLTVSTIKIIKLSFEIVIMRIILPIFNFLNFEKATSLKMILNNFKNICLALVFSAISVKIYITLVAYIQNKDLETYVSVFLQVGLGLAVMDGPTIIDKLTGIDAGLKSTSGALLGFAGGLYTGARGAASLVKNAVRGVKGGFNAGKGAAEWAREKLGFASNSGAELNSNENEADKRSEYVQESMAKSVAGTSGQPPEVGRENSSSLQTSQTNLSSNTEGARSSDVDSQKLSYQHLSHTKNPNSETQKGSQANIYNRSNQQTKSAIPKPTNLNESSKNSERPKL